MDLDLKKKYRTFKEHGGTYHDLRTGGPALYFSSEERQKLFEYLVDVDTELRQYVFQAVLSTERKKYEDLILELQTVLDDVEKRLDNLRILAEDEDEHPQLAEEIRSQVRSFEFGMCLLGPRLKIHELENAKEHFAGRRLEKKIMGMR
jgi:dsDNA-binding SOS-regulon protein